MTQRVESPVGVVSHYIFSYEELKLLMNFFGLEDLSEILANGLGYPFDRAKGFIFAPDSTQMASDIEAELSRLEIPLHRVYEMAPYRI